MNAAFGVLAAVVSVPEAVVIGFAAIVVLGAVRAIYLLQTYQNPSA